MEIPVDDWREVATRLEVLLQQLETRLKEVEQRLVAIEQRLQRSPQSTPVMR